MQVVKGERDIVIGLTQKEVFGLQAGQTIGDRSNVIYPDAKVEVLPLSAIEEDTSLTDKFAADRLDQGLAAALRGNLFPNGDLQVIVPSAKISDVRIGFATLLRQAVFTPLTENREAFLPTVIPEGGITLIFGGSLQVVDVDALSYFPPEE